MPLTLIPYCDSPLCEGFSWSIVDEGTLARVVAWLILGDVLHAKHILLSLDRDAPRLRASHVDSKIAEMRDPPASDEARWHRDGWVFQMISWIAASLRAAPDQLTRAPQPRKADKGIDGLQIRELHGGASAYLVIGEDKATVHARETIRDKVWPELAAFENGERDNEVRTDLGALLDAIPDEGKRRQVLEHILWEEDWHYRVAITVSQPHEDQETRAKLFKGYDVHVSGANYRRREAETMHLSALRTWMDAFCAAVAVEMEQIKQATGV